MSSGAWIAGTLEPKGAVSSIAFFCILHNLPSLHRLAREGLDMTLGVGNIVALICIVISIIFAIVTHQATNALWWALLAIFAVLWWGARAPWGN